MPKLIDENYGAPWATGAQVSNAHKIVSCVHHIVSYPHNLGKKDFTLLLISHMLLWIIKIIVTSSYLEYLAVISNVISSLRVDLRVMKLHAKVPQEDVILKFIHKTFTSLFVPLL